ncbi:MAG: hypothetical protein IOD12_16255 [Silvanigrellales bacterium]|jgi:hypothetical protein|nr:hypothetical protein [Silvanigrellales bacterium]
MSSDVTVTTLQTAWIAHVQDVLAGFEVVDARARRNAQLVRSLVGSQAACCCDAATVNHATRIFVPVSAVGDKNRRLFQVESALFGAWRVDSPFTPFLEVLEGAMPPLSVPTPQTLDFLDVVFGPGVEIVVVPWGSANTEVGGDAARNRKRSIRRYVAKRVWEAAGPQYSLRLTIPHGEGPPFGEDGFLRERFVPLWEPGSVAPRWTSLSLHEATPKELAQLQI